jgi:hypothetical protein
MTPCMILLVLNPVFDPSGNKFQLGQLMEGAYSIHKHDTQMIHDT